MALPSARRPAFVEEEFREASKGTLKLTFNKTTAFLKAMGEWYKNLSDKPKSKLTLVQFKKRAVHYLNIFKLAYNRLPPDWIQTLVNDYEIRFYMRRKKKALSIQKFDSDESNLSDYGEKSFTTTPFNSFIKEEEPEEKRRKITPRRQCKKEKVDGTHETWMNTSETKSVVDIKPIRPVKRLIDLTGLPPPADWLDAYLKGKHLPQALTLHCGKDYNVIFYDYDPKFENAEELKKLEYGVHDGNAFKWFQK